MGENLFGGDDDDNEAEVIDVEETTTKSETEDLPRVENQNSIVKPVEDIDAVVETYEKFEEVKDKLLDADQDLTKISGNVHVNKSGWRKIATAFNVSTKVMKKIRSQSEGIIRYEVKARAVAPNGKTAESSGMASSNESNFMESLTEGGDWNVDDEDVFKIDGKHRRIKDPRAVNEHNLMTLAETRAKNRAISDLVGGGEVSAEELAAKKKDKILEE